MCLWKTNYKCLCWFIMYLFPVDVCSQYLHPWMLTMTGSPIPVKLADGWPQAVRAALFWLWFTGCALVPSLRVVDGRGYANVIITVSGWRAHVVSWPGFDLLRHLVHTPATLRHPPPLIPNFIPVELKLLILRQFMSNIPLLYDSLLGSVGSVHGPVGCRASAGCRAPGRQGILKPKFRINIRGYDWPFSRGPGQCKYSQTIVWSWTMNGQLIMLIDLIGSYFLHKFCTKAIWIIGLTTAEHIYELQQLTCWNRNYLLQDVIIRFQTQQSPQASSCLMLHVLTGHNKCGCLWNEWWPEGMIIAYGGQIHGLWNGDRTWKACPVISATCHGTWLYGVDPEGWGTSYSSGLIIRTACTQGNTLRNHNMDPVL